MSAAKEALARLRGTIGHPIPPSEWLRVTQAMIDAFAETTMDTQWIHTDRQRAERESPYGQTIAHGFLTLSLASHFAYDCIRDEPGQTLSLNYGFNRLRFLSPVRCGQRIRGQFVLQAIDAKSDTALLRTYQLTIEIDDEERPALAAEWLSMIVFDEQ